MGGTRGAGRGTGTWRWGRCLRLRRGCRWGPRPRRLGGTCWERKEAGEASGAGPQAEPEGRLLGDAVPLPVWPPPRQTVSRPPGPEGRPRSPVGGPVELGVHHGRVHTGPVGGGCQVVFVHAVLQTVRDPAWGTSGRTGGTAPASGGCQGDPRGRGSTGDTGSLHRLAPLRHSRVLSGQCCPQSSGTPNPKQPISAQQCPPPHLLGPGVSVRS